MSHLFSLALNNSRLVTTAVTVCIAGLMISVSATLQAETIEKKSLQRADNNIPHPINTRVWRCGDDTFVGRLGAGEVAVFLPQGYKVLSQISFIDDPVYQEDDVKIRFEDRAIPAGENVTLEIGEQHYQHCKNDRYAAIWEHAKLTGVQFRALGNEPGWILELGENNRAVLSANYHQVVVEAPMQDPENNQSGRHSRYQLTTFPAAKDEAGTALQIDIWAETCLDSMSGEQFETRVTVKMAGAEWQGCGKSLY